MEHQEDGLGVPTDNSQLEIQEQASDEIPAETSEFVTEVIEEVDNAALETATTEERLEVDEKSNNEETVSDPPSTRSKSSKHGSKKSHSKQKKDDVEINEIQTLIEVRNGNDLTEQEPTDDVSVMTKEETEVVKDDTHDVSDPAPGETNGIIDATEEPEPIQLTEYAEPAVEDEKSLSAHEIFDEEISVTAVSFNEITRSADKHLEGSEKYTLSIKSSEIHQYKANLNEEPFSLENSVVSGSSLGGNIRSVSARRPVRKHVMLSERSSISSDRQGNVRLSSDGNHSDTDCSVDTTQGSIFASLKRKAFECDNMSSKKRKVSDAKNSTFFTMVSSPLRLLRNKLSDRIMEGHTVLNTEDISIDKNDDECINDKIKKGNNDIKETSQFLVAEENNTQNVSLYRSWCSIM